VPDGALAELLPDELAADDVEAAALLLLLLELLLLPQADSAIALIKHAAATTRNDLGRRMRARMLLCCGMLPNLLRVSARLGTARL
jgi:hypothetical protein